MARFIDKSEFINQNVNLAESRITSQYSTFLEQKPTFTTFYHVNTRRSTTDKGLKDIEGLIDSRSPIRYNKIYNFPLYGIEQIQLDLQEEDEGLNSSYDGNAVILPNTIYPLPDDYFYIDYLGRKALFRVTDVKYDTIKSNGYYNIAFTIKSVDEHDVDVLDTLVVEEYNCVFENIGTGDNCLIKSEDLQLMNRIRQIYENLKTGYLQKYLNAKYNALLYMVSSENIMYDYTISRFVNRNQIFYDKKTNNTVYVYEEERQVNNFEYENTIYDRVVHKDFDDWEEVLAYFNVEPTFMMAEVSIFDYYRDRRIKYMQFFDYPIGPFNDSYYKYISKDFLHAIEYQDSTLLPPKERPWEHFVFMYCTTDNVLSLTKWLDNIDRRRFPYSLETFVFIPLVLYSLRQLINQLTNDSKASSKTMDEHLLKKND